MCGVSCSILYVWRYDRLDQLGLFTSPRTP